MSRFYGGEMFGVVGMAYVYWGYIWGILFFFIWSFILTSLYESHIHAIYKVILINTLMVDLFLSGQFVSPLQWLYQSIFAVLLCCFIYSIMRGITNAGEEIPTQI
jgi:hypothetical protein